jgi:hypothetical protein
MLTPHDLIELVMGKVGRSEVAVCLTQRAFHRLRRACINELGISRTAFHLDQAMDKLLPIETRKTLLPRIYKQAGATMPPKLQRSSFLQTLIFVGSLAAGTSGWFAIAHARPGNSLLLNFVEQTGWVVGFVIWVGTLRLGFDLTKGMELAFPPNLTTVRGHARWLVANHPELLGGPPGQWSREQVVEKVRDIVIDVLGCDKNYREEARFVQDLGLA